MCGVPYIILKYIQLKSQHGRELGSSLLIYSTVVVVPFRQLIIGDQVIMNARGRALVQYLLPVQRHWYRIDIGYCLRQQLGSPV